MDFDTQGPKIGPWRLLAATSSGFSRAALDDLDDTFTQILGASPDRDRLNDALDRIARYVSLGELTMAAILTAHLPLPPSLMEGYDPAESLTKMLRVDLQIPIQTPEDALAAFESGACLRHTGQFLDEDAMVEEGSRLIDAAVDFIDTTLKSRDLLLPLLARSDNRIRVTAASAVIQSRPDLAFPILRHSAMACTREAGVSASMILFAMENDGEYCGLCKPDPLYPLPGRTRTEAVRKS